jgi:hypothetical protein
VDVDHLVPFVEALDRANHHAVGVLAGETRFGDDVRHDQKLLAAEGLLMNFLGGLPTKLRES